MKENQASWIEPHLDISGVLSKPCHLGHKILVLFWPVDLCQQTFWSLNFFDKMFLLLIVCGWCWSLSTDILVILCGWCLGILLCYISLSSGLWNMDDWHKYPMKNKRNHQVGQLTSGWWVYEWVDVCLIFLTNSNVVSPGSNDSTHMCGNDGNDPPKKVQELETLVHCCTLSLCYLGAEAEIQISITKIILWATNYI